MIIEFINSEYIHDILHILICKNKYITHTCHPSAVLCTITMRNDPSAKFTFIDCFIASADYGLLPFQISLAILQLLFSISQFFLQYAQGKGLDTGAAQGYAIVPVMVGDSMVAGFLANALFRRGIYVMPITFPAVKEGEARLRFFLSAAHSEEQIRQALDAVAEELPRAREIVANYKREHIEDPADD